LLIPHVSFRFVHTTIASLCCLLSVHMVSPWLDLVPPDYQGGFDWGTLNDRNCKFWSRLAACTDLLDIQ